MKQFKKQLQELLQIQAPSGQEAKVVKYLKPELTKLVDKCWTDTYGNLLAEKKVGNSGVTVLLSAHMDSVRNIQQGRQVKYIPETDSFYSTKGVLGADDRAGIAIIMAVLRNIEKSGFDGTIKVAFSREEEIGCVGAGKIDPNWLKGTNLAIVVDRRGNRDIVINAGGWQPFCDLKVGKFFEDCGALQGMDDWKAVDGGISDATVFSELNINSVNLSAGYRNEHTDKEYVVVSDSMSTIRLIMQAMALVEQFAGQWGDVPMATPKTYSTWNNDLYSDKWDYSWSDTASQHLDSYRDMEFFYDDGALGGEVSASAVEGFVSIVQSDETYGKQEIFLSEKTMDMLIAAYEDMKWDRKQIQKAANRNQKLSANKGLDKAIQSAVGTLNKTNTAVAVI
jgi:putative aminopeptidase FrvX